MSISRNKISNYIFSELAAYADSDSSRYQYDLKKCYIDFVQKDKDSLEAVKKFSMQEFIPNAKFAISDYKEKKILMIAGDREIDIDDGVLAGIEVNPAIILYGIYKMRCQINIGRRPIEVYNDILCQPEDDGYHGHNFDDIKDFFENITVYEIIENRSICNDNVYAPYAYYLLKKIQDKPGKWMEKTIDAIEKILLSGNNKLPYHNIVLALLSNQWNHTFLETYRCIEHLFHTIKLEPFYNTLKTSLSLTEVSREIEDKISWRPNEESTLEDIFKEIEPLHIAADLKIIKEKSDKNMKMGKWYYQQRNSIAHYRAIHTPLKYDNKEWNVLICFNFRVMEYLYDKYKNVI